MMNRGPNSRRDRRVRAQQTPLTPGDLHLTGALGILTNKKLFIVASAVFAIGIVLSLFFGILGLSGTSSDGAPMQANEAPDVPRDPAGTPTASGTPGVESTPAAVKRYTIPPVLIIDPAKKYEAKIETTKGNIVIDLFPDQALQAVNSFVYLANDGYYNNTPFMQIVKNPDGTPFTAQAGDPTRTGLGTPGYSVKKEATSRPFVKGAVGMGGSSTESNGGQFFISLGNYPALNGKYTIIGQVTQGLDLLDKLTLLDLTSGKATGSSDTIKSITLTEK